MAKRSPRTAGDQQRRVSLTVKILPELRDRLEALAEEDGRTLGNEIEKRLLKSLSLNDEILALFDNPRTTHALSAIAASWKAVEILLERQWYDDRETLAAAQTSAHAIVGMIKPHSEVDTTAREETPAAQRMIAAEVLGRKLAEHTRRRFKKLPIEDDPELDDALMALGIGSGDDDQDP